MKVTDKIASICFLTGLILILSHAPLSALMLGISTEELTRNAELVVSGKVERVESSWTADGKSIVTRATVLIDEPVKGQQQDGRLVVEYEGGEVGSIGLKVSDMSPLVKGSDVILFLKSSASRAPLSAQDDAKKTYRLVGKSQGVYTIDENGVARKSGFSVMGGEAAIDNNISRQELIHKIRSMR